MNNKRSVLATLAALVASAAVATAQDEPAEVDYTISEYTVGTAPVTIGSSYDHQPQIETLPDDPTQKIVPLQWIPWNGEWVQDGAEAPHQARDRVEPPGGRVKKYAGFEGITQTPWVPPDPSMAVGPRHIVTTVNMQINWYTKDGTLEFSQRLDNSGNPGFFEDVGAGNFTFDPKCVYDEISERFFVVALEVYSNTAYITFAVSDDSDPNGTWYKYRTDARTQIGGSTYWVDYPGLGYDDEAFYVCGNLFGFSGGFGGVKYRVITKASVLNGGSAVFLDLRDGGSASAQCTAMHAKPVAPFFVSVADSNEIRIQAITNATTAPVLNTLDVDVDSFGQPPSAPNIGGNLSTVDWRIFNAEFKNRSLVATHNIGSGGRAVARWYEFRPGNWPTSGSVNVRQQGNIDGGSGVHTFFPAITRNGNGDIAVVFGRSTSSTFPEVYYTYRASSDPNDTMRTPRLLRAGEAGYSGRWGDYFDVALDPVNDQTMWGIGEYAGAGGWKTYIGIMGIVQGMVNDIGNGSAGSGGEVPALAATTPVICDSFDLTVSNSIGGASYFHILGFNQANIDYKGSTFYIDFPWNLLGPFVMEGAGSPGAGSDTISSPVPLDPRLSGFIVYDQALILDPGAASGVATTQALELVIGERD